MTGEFKPGERMVEAKVAKSFGVSITPVREAFSELEKQGLLRVFPYCGTYVTILTKESAQELISVRQQLEKLAAKLAYANLKSEDAEYLQQLCVMADTSTAAGEYLASVEYDVQFHEFFFEKAGNSLLLELWNILKERVTFFQSVTRPNCSAVITQLVDRHGKIVKAVREMDLNALLTALDDHLESSMKRAELPEGATVSYRNER